MNNYYRDSYLEINVDTMLSNLKEIKEKCSSDKFLYAVIKGNGYGHGIIEMATMAQASKADGLAVATLDEALIVRKYIKDMKILCLGIIREQDYLIAAQHDITLTIANSTSIEHILNCNLVKDIKVHIKVNTGMNRIGFKEISEIEDAIEQLSTNDKIEIEGIFTHFATADGEQLREYFDMQFAKFKETIENLSYDFKHIHCSNSGTLLKHYDKMDFCTATRVGIAMYGGLEDEALNNFDVKAGLRLISTINQVQQYPVGAKIGYSNNYTVLSENEYIATIPLGYADGFPRLLTGSKVKCNEQYGTIVGSICMDQMMISFDNKVEIGEQVILMDLDKELDVFARAKHAQTITHEIYTNFTSRLPRIYLENNVITNINNSLSKE